MHIQTDKVVFLDRLIRLGWNQRALRFRSRYRQIERQALLVLQEITSRRFSRLRFQHNMRSTGGDWCFMSYVLFGYLIGTIAMHTPCKFTKNMVQ